MSGLRAKYLVHCAIAVGLLAVVVLPLSHLGANHEENCPLCNPMGHAALAAPEVLTVLEPATTPSQTVLLVSASPRLAQLRHMAGRAPPTQFTS